MSNRLKMTEKEATELAWIHSNKFTTPDLYKKKFLTERSFQYACRIIKSYAAKGFLHVIKPHKFLPSYYFLTGGAIRTLDEMGTTLVRTTKYPVHINPYEREHDLIVQEIRIYFEAASDLDETVWVSDFEMRSGISLEAKKMYLEGTLDTEKWRSEWAPYWNRTRRTPDAHFETEWNFDKTACVLEYEHTPYNEKMFNRMVNNLERSFPDAIRLIVSANEKNSLRMMKTLKNKVDQEDWGKWLFSDMYCVRNLIFKKIWSPLSSEVD